MRKLFLTLTTMVMAVAILNAQKQDIKLRVQVGQKVPLRFQ